MSDALAQIVLRHFVVEIAAFQIIQVRLEICYVISLGTADLALTRRETKRLKDLSRDISFDGKDLRGRATVLFAPQSASDFNLNQLGIDDQPAATASYATAKHSPDIQTNRYCVQIMLRTSEAKCRRSGDNAEVFQS